MLFRGPFIGKKSWKQSMLQLIQEIRNQVEVYRPTMQAGGDVAAGRIVGFNGNRTVGLADNAGAVIWCDGVTEESIVDTYRGRVRYSGFVRCKLITGLGPFLAGAAIWTSATPGEGTTIPAASTVMVGRVYDISGYAVDEHVIIRLTCCQAGGA